MCTPIYLRGRGVDWEQNRMLIYTDGAYIMLYDNQKMPLDEVVLETSMESFVSIIFKLNQAALSFYICEPLCAIFTILIVNADS